MGTLKGYVHHHQCYSTFSSKLQRNILITNETPPRACLADFGLSTLTPCVPAETTTTTAGGTPLYMAPELLNPEKFGRTSSRPTQPADVYAFGMVIYEVLTGLDPFYGQKLGTFQLVCRVVDGERPTKPGNAEHIGFGNGTWKLVKECWKTKSTKRPTIERVLAHLAHVSAPSVVPGPNPQMPHNESDDSPEFDPPTSSYFAIRDKLRLNAKGPLRLLRSTMVTTRNPNLHIQRPGDLRRPSLTSHGEERILTDPEIVLRQWQDLASRDPGPIDPQLLTALVDTKESVIMLITRPQRSSDEHDRNEVQPAAEMYIYRQRTP